MPKETVNHPEHYNEHPSGIECIDVAEHMGFNLGNALKYIWRCDLKKDAIEDLKKAQWYINRELEKRQGMLIEAPEVTEESVSKAPSVPNLVVYTSPDIVFEKPEQEEVKVPEPFCHSCGGDVVPTGIARTNKSRELQCIECKSYFYE